MTSVQMRKAYLLIGGAGLLLAIVYIGLSFKLPFGELDQPGAAVFPIIVGVLLIFASLATLWEGWRFDKSVLVQLPAGEDRKRVLSLIGLLVGYFIALPWLGQIISSTLFLILLMRVLSGLSWPRIVCYSLAISLMLYAVFVLLLKVPMPRGMLLTP